MQNWGARINYYMQAHMRCFGHAPLIEVHAHITAPDEINGQRIPYNSTAYQYKQVFYSDFVVKCMSDQDSLALEECLS